jgi:2-dehydro-3-deoxyphosphogluconate aldolase/(4S)-4-hydroxy-2-oxoglutarate aldolase
MMETIHSLLEAGPVIPVVTIEDAADAVPLARALVAGGVRTIEVTLRSAAALDALQRIVAEVPEMIAGIGTATTPGHLDEAKARGARFAVSPGLALELVRHARALELPFLPGTATASEVLTAQREGLDRLKFFPAEPAGGIPMLRQLGPVFPEVHFCPTGGLNAKNFRDYLALSNVACVGGSWLTPAAAVRGGDWARVTELAAAAIDSAGRTA